jgi:NAD(P)-dependent dehydrogenase (short-subunit alcohol dehydrogenase family)
VTGRLAGKVALISGAARGQGEAHARLFAEEGARLVLTDVLDDLGTAVSDELGAAGADVVYQHCDVAVDGQWAACVALAEERFGRLDVLVNNAGVVSLPSITETTDAEWDRVIAINQKGVFLGMRHAVPALQRAGGGSIVNVSSIYGIRGVAGYAAYQASKGAVVLLTKTAALSYGGDGIRVNTVAPGVIYTKMAEEEGEEAIKALVEIVPLRRGARPREVSYAVLFLASDEASYVTGTELVVDGGLMAQ